jgi:hypothetical protein
MDGFKFEIDALAGASGFDGVARIQSAHAHR